MEYIEADRQLRVRVRLSDGSVVDDNMSFVSHHAQCEKAARDWLNAQYNDLPAAQAALVAIQQPGEPGEMPAVPDIIDSPDDLQAFFARRATAQAAIAAKQADVDAILTDIAALKEELRWLLEMKTAYGKQPWLVVTWQGNRKAIGVYASDVVEQDYVEGAPLPTIT